MRMDFIICGLRAQRQYGRVFVKSRECSQERLEGCPEFIGLVAREVVEAMAEADLADDLQRRAAHPREHIYLGDVVTITSGVYPLHDGIACLRI